MKREKSAKELQELERERCGSQRTRTMLKRSMRARNGKK